MKTLRGARKLAEGKVVKTHHTRPLINVHTASELGRTALFFLHKLSEIAGNLQYVPKMVYCGSSIPRLY